MIRRRKFISFELNEVPLRVYRYYADRHPRSAVARLLNQGRRWETVSEDEGHLSPWITWPTVHRGVSNRKHRISVLGQDVSDADAHYPPVWTLLARAGRRVGMFGSLHTYPLPSELGNFAFYLPDTFAAGAEAHPSELSVFQSFNLAMVDGSGRNVSSELPVARAIGFLGHALQLGLRPGTMAKIARQIGAERLKPHRTVRRRTIQSLLSFDLFLHQLTAQRPDAAFYFTNHVASSLHRYWPATFGDDYREISWQKEWTERFADEIDYAMGEADAMLADLIAFVERESDYVLLIGGSMGQAAVDQPRAQIVTQVLLRDAERFVAALGNFGTWSRRRTMEPCYTFTFEKPADAGRFVEAAARLSIGGERVAAERVDQHGVEIMLGQVNLAEDDAHVLLGNKLHALDALGLENVRIQDEVGSAAYHVPEGVLIIYDPRADGRGEAGAGPISTTRIAPTMLALLDVDRPEYMEAPIPGITTDRPLMPDSPSHAGTFVSIG